MTIDRETDDAPDRPDGDHVIPEMLALSDPVHRRLLMRLSLGSATADTLAALVGLELSEVQRGLEHLVEIRLVVRQREGVGHEMFYDLDPRAAFTPDGEFTRIVIRCDNGMLSEIELRVLTAEWM
ncbi:MAG: winged helix-turn-helix transcriptional regulator [Phycisphaeraceae bacterium]|nr:winged helix-turn-helix domain-containing protein [Phycisphaerales bacterium]QOJ16803.1 MAG: winged helix-turn-helix transcriptional regulator [Phycisphaeraceae bacterium]